MNFFKKGQSSASIITWSYDTLKILTEESHFQVRIFIPNLWMLKIFILEQIFIEVLYLSHKFYK